MNSAQLQCMIENKAGINKEVANYMMTAGTQQAKNAMSLLKMAVDRYEECAMTLLTEAVKDCVKDMQEKGVIAYDE